MHKREVSKTMKRCVHWDKANTFENRASCRFADHYGGLTREDTNIIRQFFNRAFRQESDVGCRSKSGSEA